MAARRVAKPLPTITVNAGQAGTAWPAAKAPDRGAGRNHMAATIVAIADPLFNHTVTMKFGLLPGQTKPIVLHEGNALSMLDVCREALYQIKRVVGCD